MEKMDKKPYEIEIEGSETKGTEEVAERSEVQSKETEYLDMLQRLKAEFDNYRRRTEKEKQELADYVRGDLIRELLPVLDDFERLLEAETDARQLKEGARMIYQNLLSVLNKYGLEAFAAEGEHFDPNVHEAVAVTPAPQEHDGKVLSTWQKGYRLKDRVIRHAKVQVGQHQSGKEGEN